MTNKFSFELPYKNATLDYLEFMYWPARYALRDVTKGGSESHLTAIHAGDDYVYGRYIMDGLRELIRFDDAINNLVKAIGWIIGALDDDNVKAIRNEWLGTTEPMSRDDLPDAVKCFYTCANSFLAGAEFAEKQQELWGQQMALTH